MDIRSFLKEQTLLFDGAMGTWYAAQLGRAEARCELANLHFPVDTKARVTVRNVGETIDPEELPRLFERFHKSDKSRSRDKDGVGLGLYIVRTILEQHKEKINVTSEDGVTTFTFYLATK